MFSERVLVSLDSYPFNKYGTIEGEVYYISPSSQLVENIGDVYITKVKFNNINSNIDIFSGLTGNAEIKTGKRNIMSYFLDPIIKGLNESIKEK